MSEFQRPEQALGSWSTEIDGDLLESGLCALQLGPGAQVACLGTTAPLLIRALADEVGVRGRVDVWVCTDEPELRALALSLPQVRLCRQLGPELDFAYLARRGCYDAIWLGLALPSMPDELLACVMPEGGRVLAAVGPRFRAQELRLYRRAPGRGRPQRVAKVQFGVAAGSSGWVRRSQSLSDCLASRRVCPPGLTLEAAGSRAHYYWLWAHVDLGQDAANIFEPRLGAQPWAEELRAAHAGSPIAERYQFAGISPDFAGPPELGDRRLDTALKEAHAASHAEFMTAWVAHSQQAELRKRRFLGVVWPILEPLRQLLWATAGRDAPPLVVYDCPALGRHGRMCLADGAVHVGLSLARSPEGMLWQVFHEDLHALTDPIVRRPDRQRTTGVQSSGYIEHQRIETAALELGRAIVTARMPELLWSYEAWATGALPERGVAELFREGLERRPAPLNQLPRLDLELSTACDHSCGHCYNVWGAEGGDPQAIYQREAQLDNDALVTAVTQLAERTGIRHVTVTGGEPLLRPGVNDLLERLCAAVPSVSLISNGSHIDTHRAQLFAAMGLRSVQLTLLSAHRGLHDQLKGAVCFDDTLRAAAALRRAGVGVTICFVAMAANAGELEGVMELCFALGIRHLSYNRMAPAGAGVHRVERLLPSPEQVAEQLEVAHRLAPRFRMRVATAMPILPCLVDPGRFPNLHFGYCSTGSRSPNLVMDPSGRLRSCNLAAESLVDLRREPFSAAAVEAYAEQFMASLPEICRTCSQLAYCQGGCKESAFASYGDHAAEEPWLHRSRSTSKGRLRLPIL